MTKMSNNIGNEFKNQKTTMFDLYFKELEDGEKAIAFFLKTGEKIIVMN